VPATETKAKDVDTEGGGQHPREEKFEQGAAKLGKITPAIRNIAGGTYD